MNIVSLVQAQAEQRPNETAVLQTHKSWFPLTSEKIRRESFKSVDDKSSALAHTLAERGVQAGDRVLLFMKPSIEFPIVAFSLIRLGAIPVFIDPGMGINSALKCISETGPTALIGEPIVLMTSRILHRQFSTVRLKISTGTKVGTGANLSLNDLFKDSETNSPRNFSKVKSTPVKTKTAAIVFTSGATGPAKGVVYTHENFLAQINLLQDLFKYGERDRDLAAFPLFSLISMAMGTTAIIPEMNPSKPAKASPKKLVEAILRYEVTTAGGSPAIWKNVVKYCHREDIQLPSVRALIMFGAPVPLDLIESWEKVLPNGTTYTPYDAERAEGGRSRRDCRQRRAGDEVLLAT